MNPELLVRGVIGSSKARHRRRIPLALDEIARRQFRSVARRPPGHPAGTGDPEVVEHTANGRYRDDGKDKTMPGRVSARCSVREAG